MSAAFTPGPWRISTQRPSRVASEVTRDDTGVRFVAECSSYEPGEWTDQDAANARLIAAAPELLEALQVTRGQWIRSVNAKHCLDAIAKATGAAA